MKLIFIFWSFLPFFFKLFITKLILKIKFPGLKIDGKISLQIYELLKNNISIGFATYIGDNAKLFCNSETNIKIGKYCSIASDFYAITYNHSTEYISYHVSQNKNIIDLHHDYKKGNIRIGNDVWIGNRVTVLPGVKIGNGVIIGAGSIVTKDIPDYSIAVGNPAKVIKNRFSDEKIEFFKKISWWDWEDKKIIENSKFFNINIEKNNLNDIQNSLYKY